MDFVTIDPGLKTGFAFFSNKKLIYSTTFTAKGKTWEEKTQNLCNILFGFWPYVKPKKTFIEFPVFHFRGNIKSLIKLSFLIGRIVEAWEGEIVLIPVNVWKKNLPKEVTWRRAERFFGIKGLKGDVGDAVALGRYVIKNNLWR